MKFTFKITDHAGIILTNARITVFIDDREETASFVNKTALYELETKAPLRDSLKCLVSADHYETLEYIGKPVKETIHIELTPADSVQFITCGNRKVPFIVKEGQIGVHGNIKELSRDLGKLKLSKVRVKQGKGASNFHILEKTSKPTRLDDRQKEKSDYRKRLKELRQISENMEVGPVVEDPHSGDVYILSGEIRLQPVKEIGYAKLTKILAEHGYAIVGYFLDQPIIKGSADKGIETFDIIDVLIDLGVIEGAYPIFYDRGVEDYEAGNFLWPGQYCHKLINVEGAWGVLDTFSPSRKFGIGDLVVGVHDSGLAQTPDGIGGFTEHPSFAGNVTLKNGSTLPKILQRHDFINKVADNNNPPDDDGKDSTHGVSVCGIALGNATPDGSTGPGAAGVAPETRVLSTIIPNNNTTRVAVYYWLAGLRPYADGNPGNDLPQLTEGVDLIMSSQGNSINETTEQDIFSPWVRDALLYGRQGKGLLMIRSAGNESTHHQYVPGGVNRFSSYEGVLSIGAVSYFPAPVNFRKSVYSNTGKIDFCAPSSNGGRGRQSDTYDPPRLVGTWAATIGGRGTLPGPITGSKIIQNDIQEPYTLLEADCDIAKVFPRATARQRRSIRVITAVSASDTTIPVEKPIYYQIGGRAWIYDSDTKKSEYFTVASVSNSGTSYSVQSVAPLTNSYTTKARVYGGTRMPSTTLGTNSSSGSSAITVTSANGFSVGMRMRIYDYVNDRKEYPKIASISGNTLNLTGSLTHPYAVANVVVEGLVTIKVDDASFYSESDYITLEYLSQGQTFYDAVLVRHTNNTLNEIYVSALAYNHVAEDGFKVNIYRDNYSLIGSSATIPGPLPLNYNPDGVYTSPFTIPSGELVIHLNNGTDFVDGTYLKVSDGTNTEWKYINGIYPDTSGSGADLLLDSVFTNGYTNPDIKGYPAIYISNKYVNLNVGDYIKTTHSSGTIYAQVIYFDAAKSKAALSPDTLPALSGVSWGPPERVPCLLLDSTTDLTDVPDSNSVLIGEPGFDEINHTENSESTKIEKILPGNRVILSGVRKGHSFVSPDVLRLYYGPLNYDDNFGGTSSACPTVAGVIALMLAANQDLTWREIIDILKSTSVKVDLHTQGYSGDEDDTTGNVDDDGDLITFSPSENHTTRPLRAGQWKNKNGDYIFQTDGNTLTPGLTDTVPYHSDWYGHGMVDAEAAVQAAKDYVNKRDLVIRDSLSDTGTAATPMNVEINSPDIFIRNVPPFTYSSLLYTDLPPHQNPLKMGDRYVYVRIKNIGTAYPSLPAKVRIFMVIDDPGTQFKFPDHFREYGDVTAPDEKAVKLLHEFDLADGEIGAGSEKLLHVLWPENFTNVSTPKETNILVQITPHDGPYHGPNGEGDLLQYNNNLSRKKVTFRNNIEIRESASVALKNLISIPSTAISTLVTQSFEVDLADVVDFNSEDAVVTVTRHSFGGSPEIVEFKYTSGWGFVTPPSTGWVTLNAPLIEPFGVTDLATGAQRNIRFVGSFSVDGTVDKITIRCDYTNSNGVAATETKTVDVRVQYEPDYGAEIDPIEKNRAYFFTEAHLLDPTQPTNGAFGPDATNPTTVFHLTNKFTATANPKAFAVSTGQVLVQQTSDPDLVNVIIKPIHQGGIDFLDVKYFVYRGVLKEKLISTSDPLLVAATGTNAFVTSIWDTQNAINAAIENADPDDTITPGSVTDQPSALSLGIQYVHTAVETWQVQKLDSDSLDAVFYDGSTDYKFPIIKAGQDFGEFHMAGFGFEIVLNNAASKTTFADVRGTDNTLTVAALSGSPTPLQKLQDRKARHKVLEYMDPAAFYGVHLYSGINAYDSAGVDQLWKEDEAYDKVIKKFTNRNRVYIDIRNENGYNFNYYDNYTNAGNEIRLSFDSNVAPAAQAFGTSGWPIRIVENTELEGGNEGSKNAMWVELPKGDITAALLYQSFASEYRRFPKPPKNKKRFIEVEFQGTNLYSETIHLGLPNIEDLGGTTAPAWYVKLDYIRRNNAANTPGNAIVVNGKENFDHIFPVADTIPWDSTDQILFNTGFQSRYFEKEDFSFYGELGFAKEAGRVIFYIVPEEVNFQPNKYGLLYKKIIGSTSNKTSFFEVLKNTFTDFRLLKRTLTVGGNEIFYLNYDDGTKSKKKLNDKHNFVCLGMTNAEYNTLTASATAASLDASLHNLTLFVKTKTVMTDDTGKGFFKYEVGIAGIDTGGTYTEAAALIDVYSVDGVMLTSSDFADAEVSAEPQEACITFGLETDVNANTTFGQVIKRVSLFTDVAGTTHRKWKMYTAAGAPMMYTNTDVSNFGAALTTADPIELPAGTRVIILECKPLGVETIGSVNYIRVVTWYNGQFREGYISEHAVRNSTDERTLSPDDITPDEQFDALINDMKLDRFMARKIVDDPTHTAYMEDASFVDLVDDVEAAVDPSQPAAVSIVAKWNALTESQKMQWVSVLRGIENYFKFDYYEDQEKGLRIDYPATANKYMSLISSVLPFQSLDSAGGAINPLFLPFTPDWLGSPSLTKAGYNTTITDFVKNNGITTLPNETGDNGASYDDGVGGAPDGDFTQMIEEMKKLRDKLTGITLPAIDPNDPLLQTKEARWFTTPVKDDTFFNAITDIASVWNEAWVNEKNPSHLTTDFRAGYIGVDCSLGFVNSSNVLCILIHEWNVGDTRVLRLADDTHTYFSAVPVGTGPNTKYVAETGWEYVKANDFQTFFGHGFHPGASYTDGNGNRLGRENYSASKNICDFLQRNPSIGVIYAKYIINKLLTL